MQGEYLSPLDLCQEEGPLYDLLMENNALPGSALTRPTPSSASGTVQPTATTEVLETDKVTEEETDGKMATVGHTSHDDSMSVPGLRRPTTPSRLSFSKMPGFDKDQWARPSSPQPVRPPTPATPPPPSPDLKRQGPGMLKKAFELMRKRKKTTEGGEGDSPALASAIGFFSSQATMLVATVVGKGLFSFGIFLFVFLCFCYISLFLFVFQYLFLLSLSILFLIFIYYYFVFVMLFLTTLRICTSISTRRSRVLFQLLYECY